MFNAMLKLYNKLTSPAVPAQDAIKASITIASQRNEAAADNLKEVISELLIKNDRLRTKGRTDD